jgi:hypothetical protein
MHADVILGAASVAALSGRVTVTIGVIVSFTVWLLETLDLTDQ